MHINKKIWWITGVILIIGVIGFVLLKADKNLTDEIETEQVKITDLARIIGETGIIEANQEVNLSFETSGLVSQIFVNEGDTVKAGERLISLQADKLNADIQGAVANVEFAKAQLRELEAGTRNIETLTNQVQVNNARTSLEQARVNLENTNQQQQLLVEQSEKNLFTTDIRAYLTDGIREASSFSYTPPTITGVYNSNQQGEYNLELYASSSSSGHSLRYTGLESGRASASTTGPIELGNKGLFIQFPSDFARNTNIEWTIPIPNTRSSSYQSLINAIDTAKKNRDLAILKAEQAVETASSNLNQAIAQLDQTNAPARPETIQAQQAAVKQAQASVSSIQALQKQKVITAPFDGIVNYINTERGELISPGAAVVGLVSNDKFQIKVNIAEADIQELNLGDPAKVSFDAYRNEEFDAKVTYIAPTASTINNVTSFKTTLQFLEQNPKIRSGLSANVDIIADSKENVVAVPLRAVFEDENGLALVRVIKDGEISRKKVKTGLRGSNGYIEVVSGIKEGETVITFLDEDTSKIVETNEQK